MARLRRGVSALGTVRPNGGERGPSRRVSPGQPIPADMGCDPNSAGAGTMRRAWDALAIATADHEKFDALQHHSS